MLQIFYGFTDCELPIYCFFIRPIQLNNSLTDGGGYDKAFTKKA